MPAVQFAGCVPRPCRGRLGGFAALESVVLIEVAGRAQRLVVKIDIANQCFQLFAERMNRSQLGCRRGQLVLGSLKELLVSAIEEARDLATNEDARMDREGCRFLFARAGD